MRIGLIVDNAKEPDPWLLRLYHQISEKIPAHSISFIDGSQAAAKKGTDVFLKTIIAIERYILVRPHIGTTINDNIDEKRVHNTAIERIDEIEALNLQVIIDCAGVSLKHLSCLSSCHGIWTLDFLRQNPNLVGFWESYHATEVLQIKLLRYSSPFDRFEVLSEAAINTKQSASLNKSFMKEKAISLIVKSLMHLNRRGSHDIKVVETLPKLATPHLFIILHYKLKLLQKILQRGGRAVLSKLKLRPEMYYIKFGYGDAKSFDPDSMFAVYPKNNHYWADPFFYEANDKLYVFFEVYDYKKKKGHISVGCLNGDDFSFLGTALDTDYHLSFPFLFEDQGELFMLPETHEAKRIEIWRCIEFPLKWELHATALEGICAADTVLLKHQKAWWIFTNVSTDVFGDHCSELHIFKSNNLRFEKLQSHEENPVVFDSRYARNAGRVANLNGTLYRPSQINAYGEYGYGLNIMKIEDLSLSHYVERPLRRLSPDTGKYRGVHHFDSLKNRFVIDTRKRFGGWS